MAKIVRKNKRPASIPTASMSDISFLLLLFFMVSTVFVKSKGLKVQMPKAVTIDKIPRNHAATIYIDRAGHISIDDYILEVPQVQLIMMKKLSDDFNLISCFRTDRNTEYGVMADVLNQLRQANTLRVSFEAKLKR
jgi:biopolymer transport protein ExbD